MGWRGTLTTTARSLTMPAVTAALLWGASATVGAGLLIDSIPMAQSSDSATVLGLERATVSFRVILKRNLWVFGINIAGVASLGISTLGSVVANGLQTGMALAQAHRENVGLRSLVAVTLPHSLELVALWLSAAVGFLGPRLTMSFVNNSELPTSPTPQTLALVVLALAGLIVTAAALEVGVSLPVAERLRSAASGIGW